MYRIYAISAGAVQRGELRNFNPLTNSHGYDMMEAERIPQEEIPYAEPARNARPFGPNLDQRIAPPNFEAVYNGDQLVQMRIGPDVLHPQTMVCPVNSAEQFLQVAMQRIETLRNVHYMLDRSTMNELEKVSFASPEAKLSFAYMACEPGLTNNTFADDVAMEAAKTLGSQLSAYAVQNAATTFLPAYFKALQQGTGTLQENVTRAMKIACLEYAMSGVCAQDSYAIAGFAQGVGDVVDRMWDTRNQEIWQAWQKDAIAASCPDKFTAVFKHALINDMNSFLNGYNWTGDMAVMYDSASKAAYNAAEVASQQGYHEVADKYVAVQHMCMNALNKIHEDEKENAPIIGERTRGYQTYDTPIVGEPEAPDLNDEEWTQSH